MPRLPFGSSQPPRPMRNPENMPNERSEFSSSTFGLAGSPVRIEIGAGVFLTHHPRYSARTQKRNVSGAGAATAGRGSGGKRATPGSGWTGVGGGGTYWANRDGTENNQIAETKRIRFRMDNLLHRMQAIRAKTSKILSSWQAIWSIMGFLSRQT